MRLPLDAPLDLESTLYSGQAFRWRPLGDAHLGFVDGTPVLVRLDEETLHVEGDVDERAVRRYFRLDGSHATLLRTVRRDRWLAAALEAYPGLRLLRQDAWETLIAFVLSQNANEAKIRHNVEAIAGAAGQPVDFAGRRLHRFPSPAALAALDEDRLRGLGVGYRAPYVAAAADAVADGSLRLDDLRQATYEEALGRLTAVPGIGEKVADCVLLYGFGRLEAFPADVWIRRLVDQRYYKGRNKTAPYAWIRDFGRRRFGTNAGYAQHVLFHWVRRGAGDPRMNATTGK